METSTSTMPELATATDSSSSMEISTLSKEELLRLYLLHGDFSRNSNVYYSVSRVTMMPTEAIRCYSSDWNENISYLHKFLILPRAEQKIFMRTVRLTSKQTKERRQLKKNAEVLNSIDQKLRAINSVSNGEEIARLSGWSREADIQSQTQFLNNQNNERSNASSENARSADREQVPNRSSEQNDAAVQAPPPEQNDATFLKMLLLSSMDGTILFDLDKIISFVCRSSNVRTASKPTKRICYSSPDWKTSMRTLYIYLSKSKEERKEMKNLPEFKGLKDKELKENAEKLGKNETIKKAIEDTADGQEIANALGWKEREKQSRCLCPKNDQTLLRMLLTVGLKPKFDLHEAELLLYNENQIGKSSVPHKRVRFSSSNWKIAMGNVYDFMNLSKKDQKEMNSDPLFKRISKSQQTANAKFMMKSSTIRRAIASTEGGNGIATELGWIETESSRDDDEEDDVPMIGIGTSTPEREKYTLQRMAAEKRKRKKKLRVSEPIAKQVQLRLARNERLDYAARKAFAKFLDATFLANQSGSRADDGAHYTGMLVLYKSVRSNTNCGGNPSKRLKIDKPELIIISNNKQDRQIISKAMKEAKVQNQQKYAVHNIQRSGESNTAQQKLSKKVGDIASLRKRSRQHPRRVSHSPSTSLIQTASQSQDSSIIGTARTPVPQERSRRVTFSPLV